MTRISLIFADLIRNYPPDPRAIGWPICVSPNPSYPRSISTMA